MVLSTVWCVFANRISEDLRSPVRFTSIKQFDAGHVSNFLFDIIFSVKIENVLDRFSMLFSCLCSGYILLLLSKQILFQFPKRSTVWHHVQIITRSTTELTPVVESLQARKPGLQAPSNLAGSKIKNNQFFPFLILSQRCNNKYWEKHVPFYLSLFNN